MFVCLIFQVINLQNKTASIFGITNTDQLYLYNCTKFFPPTFTRSVVILHFRGHHTGLATYYYKGNCILYLNENSENVSFEL